jgi:sugar/nucleoside kinase (ribokinase family)
VQVVCVGGACIDRKYHVLSRVAPGTSNPARAERSFGGVARNVAENLTRLGVQTALCTVVGDDENGNALLEHARHAGIDVHLSVCDSGGITPEYAAVVDANGDLVVGVSDMRALETFGIDDFDERWSALAQSRWVFADCNLRSDVLARCIERARDAGCKLAVDAVSEPKVQRLPGELSGIDVLFLNEAEAAAYLREDAERFCTPFERAQALRSRGARAVMLTRGARGIVACGDGDCVEISATRAQCIDVTGAGDALVAAALFGLLHGDSLAGAARIGSLCAALTIESPSSVRADLSPAMLEEHKPRLGTCATS